MDNIIKENVLSNVRVIKTNSMHYLSSVYFVNQTLHVLGIFVARHQEIYCIYIQNFVSVVPTDSQLKSKYANSCSQLVRKISFLHPFPQKTEFKTIVIFKFIFFLYKDVSFMLQIIIIIIIITLQMLKKYLDFRRIIYP
jgi:hypothetical protein